jgi:SAM-dependent methyltransferase
VSKNKEWFEKWFSSKYYLELYSHRDEEDARWIINLLQRNIPFSTRSKVLDIACGAGRHSIELARRGFDVTGFDLSPYLIGEARKVLKESMERGLCLKFLIKDMRYFNFKKSFDIALNIFSSFGYFDDDESNFSVFKNASDSVRPGGYFLFDYLNKDYLLKNIVPQTTLSKGKYKIIQKRSVSGSFVHKEITIKEGNMSAGFEERLKLYTPSEIKRALTLFGFEVEKTFGDYFGNKFSKNDSQRFIAFARKT